MTESSPPAPSLKIRIRVEAAPSIDEAPATLDLRRVFTALVVLALIVYAAFSLYGLISSKSAERALAPDQQVAAPPTALVAAQLPSIVTTEAAPAALSTAQPTESTPASSPNQTNHITRAVLTDAVHKRQPMQELAGDLPVADTTKRFYFITDVQEVTTRRLIHRWEYRGKVVAQIPFFPSGKNWTGSSNKQIPTHMQGPWRVVLVDEHGKELTSLAFNYGRVVTAARN